VFLKQGIHASADRPMNDVKECRLNRRMAKLFQRVPQSRLGGALLGTVVGCWLLVIVGGLALMWRHGFVSGPVGNVEQSWPAEMALPRATGIPTLIMSVHPECPCSRASVDELEVLMTHCAGKLNAYVLFAEPAGLNTRIESTPLWKSAAQIPGVKAVIDKDGAMTRRFGAETSGQVFLYDPAGVLRFSGGLTASRGHEGDNDGLTAVEAIVRSRNSPVISTPVQSTPVYGCKIW
jgi:hypothetical protein